MSKIEVFLFECKEGLSEKTLLCFFFVPCIVQKILIDMTIVVLCRLSVCRSLGNCFQLQIGMLVKREMGCLYSNSIQIFMRYEFDYPLLLCCCYD